MLGAMLRACRRDSLPSTPPVTDSAFLLGGWVQKLTVGISDEDLVSTISTVHCRAVTAVFLSTARLDQGLAVAQAVAHPDNFPVPPALLGELCFVILCKHIKNSWGNRNLIFPLRGK